MRRLGFAVVTLLLQLAVCEDYFWLHNSNWDEPNNWSLGRVPCGGQNASFAAVSREYSVKTAAVMPETKIALLDTKVLPCTLDYP